MNAERLNAMYQARHLLPEPGPEVVMELIAELRKAQDHLETAWGVIANAGVSLGDWNSMTPEWREAAEKWRDEWHRMLPVSANSDSDIGVPDALRTKIKDLIRDAWKHGFDADRPDAIGFIDEFALADETLDEYWPNTD